MERPVSDFKVARYRDGTVYAGNKQFLGNGKQRSCAKCGNFAKPEGFRKVNPWGMCCPACQEKK
jgi:hypothetical protein